MIIFEPSNAIVKETNIDYTLLATIINQFLPYTKRKYKIKIHKSPQDYSVFYQSDLKICINLRDGSTLKPIVETLLHEIRHFWQVKFFKRKLQFHFKSYNAYKKSPQEVDARKFEMLATDVCRIYNSYKQINEKINLFELHEFKELNDNE